MTDSGAGEEMPKPERDVTEAAEAEKPAVVAAPLDDLTLWEVIRICAKRWRWFLAGLVVTANIVMMWHVMTPLKYEAEIRVKVPAPKKKPVKKEKESTESGFLEVDLPETWLTPDELGTRIRKMYAPGGEAGKPFGRAHIQRYQIDPTHDDVLAIVSRADSKDMAVRFVDSAVKRAEKEYQVRIDKALAPYREELQELDKQFDEQKKQQEAISQLDEKNAGLAPLIRLLRTSAQRTEALLRRRQAEIKQEMAKHPSGMLEVRTAPRSLGQVGGRSFGVVLSIGLMLGTLAGAMLALVREAIAKPVVVPSTEMPVPVARPSGGSR